MRDEHVDHPVLQHLEAADRGAELLARLGILQRRRIQLADRTDRLGTERADRAVAAGFERGDTLAFPAEQFPAHAAQADLGRAAAVDGLETLQIEIGGAAIDHEQADATAIVAMARGARGDDEIVRPGRSQHRRLLAGEHVAIAVAAPPW